MGEFGFFLDRGEGAVLSCLISDARYIMTAKQKIARMLGEFLREAAVLTAVFLPLVRLVELDKPLTFWWLFST